VARQVDSKLGARGHTNPMLKESTLEHIIKRERKLAAKKKRK
jgi:hypothetical protein